MIRLWKCQDFASQLGHCWGWHSWWYFILLLDAPSYLLTTLIPKKEALTTLANYKPISCIGVPYKIIAKIVANKLAESLSRLIAPNQTAFFRGRCISDNIGLTKEFLTGFRAQATFCQACVTIDFSKAFDMLRWDAIDISLELLGFLESLYWVVWSQSHSSLRNWPNTTHCMELKDQRHYQGKGISGTMIRRNILDTI